MSTLTGGISTTTRAMPGVPVKAVENGILEVIPDVADSPDRRLRQVKRTWPPPTRSGNCFPTIRILIVSSTRVPSDNCARCCSTKSNVQNKLWPDFTPRTLPVASLRHSGAGLQAFSVMPVIVYKVFADGRPDQLIRGADIGTGTPLASFCQDHCDFRANRSVQWVLRR